MHKFLLNISYKFCVLPNLINSSRIHPYQRMHTITVGSHLGSPDLLDELLLKFSTRTILTLLF